MFKGLKYLNTRVQGFLFLSITILFYLPVLLNPQLLLSRNNDLQEFFWPIFAYTKQYLLLDHELPLWNNMFLSGVPLLPDPQSFLFYLPNLIFLALPIGIAFITSFMIHTLIGGIGLYLCAKKAFKLSTTASLFTASLFIISPKVAGYLEAGHYGLVTSFTFLPFLLLASILLSQKQKFIYSLILAISLAGIFYTHTVTFILSSVITVITVITTIILTIPRKKWIKSSLLFCATALLTFGLIAITFLPQLEWTPETTRFLLLENRDVYPKWTSKKEFLEASFIPWVAGKDGLWNFDSEKWLSLGLLPTTFALVGFWQLKRKFKIALFILVAMVIVIALNNASPLYLYLLSKDWYVLIRVATRIWFIPVLLVIFLAGFGFEFLLKRKVNEKLLAVAVTFTVIELITISWLRLYKPLSPPEKFAPAEVYQFLKEDKEQFRVFCLNRCIPQQKAADEKLELVEGYNTLLQTNYYKHMWQLSGSYWNYYTLALPPIGAYTFQKIQPNAASLGEYNTKYILSPYELADKNFVFEKKFGNHLLYQNKLFLPRAYFKVNSEIQDIEAPILNYKPNLVKVDTSKQLSQQLILAEVYNKGWKAYLNGEKQIPILETPSSLRLVNINSDTKFVDFKYEPDNFHLGKIITISTLILISVYLGKKYLI